MRVGCPIPGCPRLVWGIPGAVWLETCWRHAAAEVRATLRAMLRHWFPGPEGCPCGCAGDGGPVLVSDRRKR